MKRVPFVLTLAWVLALSGCSKVKKEEITAKQEKEETVRPPIDACSLLTSDEIQSVQGEAVQETKPSNSSGRSFYAAQCYFELPNNTNSVVVTATQRAAGAAGRSPKEW